MEDWGDEMDKSLEEHQGKKPVDIDKLSSEDKFKRLIDKYTGDKKFERSYRPKEYWEKNKPKTADDFKEIAQAQAEGRLGTKENPSGFTKDNTAWIEEGRKRLRQESGADRPTRRGFGGGADVIEEKLTEIDATTPTDPRAGAWGVGGTMPYTEDIRTAGIETDVPLGRRFAIDKAGKYRGTTGMDLSEAMKYATLGGYSQLEPFQEYLKRRREYLGEDEPQYFDEEGNVIYSGTETT
jgi:hypothetical protein